MCSTRFKKTFAVFLVLFGVGCAWGVRGVCVGCAWGVCCFLVHGVVIVGSLLRCWPRHRSAPTPTPRVGGRFCTNLCTNAHSIPGATR